MRFNLVLLHSSSVVHVMLVMLSFLMGRGNLNIVPCNTQDFVNHGCDLGRRFAYVCMYACRYVCVCVCLCLCVCVCVCVCACVLRAGGAPGYSL